MESHLPDAVPAGTTRRIAYVSDPSGYGATGLRPVTKDKPPRPSAWGRCLTPALDRLDGCIVAGLPTALFIREYLSCAEISVNSGQETTFGQLARGGFSDSLYLGFNLARKFF